MSCYNENHDFAQLNRMALSCCPGTTNQAAQTADKPPKSPVKNLRATGPHQFEFLTNHFALKHVVVEVLKEHTVLMLTYTQLCEMKLA